MVSHCTLSSLPRTSPNFKITWCSLCLPGLFLARGDMESSCIGQWLRHHPLASGSYWLCTLFLKAQFWHFVPLTETPPKNWFSQFMLIGISGQIFFSKKMFPIFLVSMGWEGVEINAKFLFIQDGSEKRGTIRLCPCLEGVCQLCRQFFQCGSPPDNSLPNPFFFNLLLL